MIDIRQPFNGDALKQCRGAVESDCVYGQKSKLRQERAVISSWRSLIGYLLLPL
jgi:hypothetical protein